MNVPARRAPHNGNRHLQARAGADLPTHDVEVRLHGARVSPEAPRDISDCAAAQDWPDDGCLRRREIMAPCELADPRVRIDAIRSKQEEDESDQGSAPGPPLQLHDVIRDGAAVQPEPAGDLLERPALQKGASDALLRRGEPVHRRGASDHGVQMRSRCARFLPVSAMPPNPTIRTRTAIPAQRHHLRRPATPFVGPKRRRAPGPVLFPFTRPPAVQAVLPSVAVG